MTGSFVTRKCQYWIMLKIFFISFERTSIKFRKNATYGNMKSQQKAELHSLPLENTFLGKPETEGGGQTNPFDVLGLIKQSLFQKCYALFPYSTNRMCNISNAPEH